MRNYKRYKTIESKFEQLKSMPEIEFNYKIGEDNSTQKELRLDAFLFIKLNVDLIHFPKWLGDYKDTPEQWGLMKKISRDIYDCSKIVQLSRYELVKANSRSKSGAAIREQELNRFKLEIGNWFLSELRNIKKEITAKRKEITRLQAEQKKLIPMMRMHNSEVMQSRKHAKEEERAKDTAALKSGEFWKASEQAIKDYFHPPFSKNHLADVSETWRAVLFTECANSSYGQGKQRRFKMVGTGHGYLCGIDDNGDEWGHRVFDPYQSCDMYGDVSIESSVEEAMAILFDIPINKLSHSSRQGDLLFSPCEIPDDTEMDETDDSWEIRESHIVSSPGLLRNGRYFSSKHLIDVTHTSHEPIQLPAGGYQVYELQIADAD